MGIFTVCDKDGFLRFSSEGVLFVRSRIFRTTLETWLPDKITSGTEFSMAEGRYVNLYIKESEFGNADTFIRAALYYCIILDGQEKLQWFQLSGVKQLESSLGERMLRSLYQDFQNAAMESFKVYTVRHGNPFGRFCEGPNDFPRQIEVVNPDARDLLVQGTSELCKGLSEPVPRIVRQMDAGYVRNFVYPWGYGCVMAGHNKSSVMPTEENLQQVKGCLQKFSSDTDFRMMVTNFNNKNIIYWQNLGRSINQDQIMGGSANALAAAMQIKETADTKFEWLHVIAHRFGINGEDAQTARNLVWGTEYANTQMMMIEEAMTRAVMRDGGLLGNISVRVHLLKNNVIVSSPMASVLEYEYKIYERNAEKKDGMDIIYGGSISFDPLSRYCPSLYEYRAFLWLFKKDLEREISLKSMNPTAPVQDDGRLLAENTWQNRGEDESGMQTADFTVLAGLKLENPKECVVRNHVFLEKDILYAENAGRDGSETVLLAEGDMQDDVQAVTGTIHALGKEDIPVRMAVFQDGSRIAALDYSKEHFTLDQLFSELRCQNLDLFLLKDTSITVKDLGGAEDLIMLEVNGRLDMTHAPFSIFQQILGQMSELYVSSGIVVNRKTWREKPEPCCCRFSSAAVFYADLGKHFTLKSLKLDVLLGSSVDMERMEQGWKLLPALSGTFLVSHFSREPFDLFCQVSCHNQTLYLDALGDSADDFLGITGFRVEQIRLSMEVGRENEAAVSVIFPLGSGKIQAGGILGEKGAGIYTEIEDFTLYDLGGLYHSLAGKEMALPDYDIVFEEVFLSAASKELAVFDRVLKSGMRIKAKIHVHEFEFSAELLVSGKGVLLEGEIGHLTIGDVTIREACAHIEFASEESGKGVCFYIEGKTKIRDIEVSCRVDWERQNGEWDFGMYAGIEMEELTLGKFLPEVRGSFIGQFGFSRLGFLYVTKDRSYPLFDQTWDAEKGLQVVGTLLPIPQMSMLSGKEAGYDIRAHFGQHTSVSISGGGTLHLGDSVTCTPFTIGLMVTPSPVLFLKFGMDLKIPNQPEPLHFDFMLDLDAVRASGSATMKNWWKEPFGIRNVKIGPAVALELGIIYEQFLATGCPSEFGIAGGLALGDIEIQMAAKISENPMEEILTGSLERLSMHELLGMTESLLGVSLPGQMLPDILTVESLRFYFAPMGGSIGTIKYEKGISFSGKLVLFGKKAEVYARFMDEGFVIKGELDRIDLGILKIGGKKGRNLLVDMEVSLQKQSCLLDGEIEILGSKKGIYLSISKEGVAFEYEENFLSLFQLMVKAESRGELEHFEQFDFLLEAEMDQKVSEFIHQKVITKIKAAIEAVDVNIKEAERNVEEAKKKYEEKYQKAEAALLVAERKAKELNELLVQTVREEREKYQDSMETAKREVERSRKAYEAVLTAAQMEVSRTERVYKDAMDTAKRAVDQAEREYNDAMESAIREVSRAQADYDSAFGDAKRDLDEAQSDVNGLQREIDEAVYELKHLRWYEYFYKAEYLSAKIAGLETAYGFATAALQTCKGILEGVRYGTKYAVWETAKATLQAVKYGGKYTAFESAKGVLEAVKTGGEYSAFESAKGALEVVKYGTEYTVWQTALNTLDALEKTGDSALRAAEYSLEHIGETGIYLTLEACRQTVDAVGKGTEFLAFESAKAALEAARIGSETMLMLGEKFLQGAFYVLDIRRIRLSSSLKKIEAGELFLAEIDLVLLGKEHHFSIDCDLSNGLALIDALYDEVMGGMQELVMNG